MALSSSAAADTAWIKMIIPDEAAPAVVGGSVVLWSHEGGERARLRNAFATASATAPSLAGEG